MIKTLIVKELCAVFLIVFLLCSIIARSNNIQVSNISTSGLDANDKYNYINFDLSWENSWYYTIGPANWDAAWVFIKYSSDDGASWHQAYLNNSGNSAGDSAVVQVGLLDESTSYNATSNPAVGAFVYRSTEGCGDLSATVKLRWNFGDNGVSNNTSLKIKVFAIEMVHVPQGSYYLGSGGSDQGPFYTYNSRTTPYQVASESAIYVGTTTGYLYYSTSYGDSSGPVPAAFPKGYADFTA